MQAEKKGSEAISFCNFSAIELTLVATLANVTQLNNNKPS